MIDLLALTTGLRVSEIKSLTRAGFDFSSEPVTVAVKAAYTKNGDDAVLPLRPDVAEELSSYLANKLPTTCRQRADKTIIRQTPIDSKTVKTNFRQMVQWM